MCLQCLGHTGLPCSMRVCFSSLHCLGSRFLCRERSEASPRLYALPRSKPLRFRYSGSPQRCRLGWACVLCPSQIRAAQVTRCLVSAVSVTYHLPHSCRLIFWLLQPTHLLRRMLAFQNPKKSWLAMKPASSLVDNTFMGPWLPPGGSGWRLLPVSGGVWAGLQPTSSAQSFVLWAGLTVS